MTTPAKHADVIDRRDLLLGAAAASGAALLPTGPGCAAGRPTGLASAAEFTAAAERFLARLAPDKRKQALFAWNGTTWKNWNYFGFPSLIKPGLRLEQMSDGEKVAAWDLLALILSPVGLEKARNVMTLQAVLAQRGDRSARRSSERFSLAFFAQPSVTGAWGFRLEGHHLSLSIAVHDNLIVSVTPSSFSANPNRVARGPHRGLVTLQAEEDLARRLAKDLDHTQLNTAQQSANAMRNILSMAGRERRHTNKQGLPAADLKPGQRDLIWQLVEAYAVDHLTPELAAAQRRRIRSGDQSAVHFAWYGPNDPNQAFGYRIIGDSLVIELGSVDPRARHLHTIYHDVDNVLGSSA